jgi:protocatechuate 3,4-dioxygenase beta subunit
MGNLGRNKEMNRRKSNNSLEDSSRFSFVAILALVVLFGGVIYMLLNFFVSGDDEINPAGVHLAKKSSTADQEGQETLRSPMGGTETSQTKAAFRSKGANKKSIADRRKIRQPDQNSSNAQPGDQPDAQPYGQSGDQAGIQTDSISNDEIEDGQDEELEDEPEEESEEESEDEPQDFSISGWVFTQAGVPVPWIKLTARARQLFQADNDWESAGTAREQSTQTDSDGFFEFWQLVDGEYEVRTQATERYLSARAVLRAGTASATLTVKEEEEQEVYVHGIVESSQGKRLAGVRVLPIGQKLATTTDETGSYGLYLAVSGSRQSYPFRFMKQGYREQRPKLGKTDVGGVESVRLDVTMDPLETLATVTGTVTGPAGSPVVGASVQLFSTSLARSYRAGTKLDGDFIIPRVEISANYRLWVRPKDHYKDYIESGLEVPATGLDLAIVLEPQGLSSLRGQMVDLNGKPVPNFGMWLRCASAAVPPTLPVTGDGFGDFFVDELPAGEVSFQTKSIPYISVSGIELAPGAEEYVQLILDWGNHMLEGYVLNSKDAPVPGAEVSLLWQHDNKGIKSHSRRKTVADAGGYFLFSQLGQGLHTLNVTAPGFYSARREYEVKTPGVEITVQLAAVTP